MPEATAAAEPPLEPPVECSGFQGLRDGPCASGSVVIVSPSSGVFVLPTTTRPASRNFANWYESWSATYPSSFRKRIPPCQGSPAE
jgi:hypothetical protein